MAKKTESTIDEKIINAFEKPLSFSFIIIGLYIVFIYFPLTPPTEVFAVKVLRSLVIFVVTWGLYNLSSTQSHLLEDIKTKFNLDDILIQFFSKVVRFIVIAIGILMIAQEFDYDVNGFIAGLGLGGLAFALAAKDALANVFGGIIIILEKPFLIGDWIKVPSAEGTVEEITFRSTKIRAFDQSLITIPNASLANDTIVNFSKMGKRRISFYLGLSILTPHDKVQTCVKRIETMIKNHPDVHPDTIMVYFEKFSDNSLDIKFYFFTKTTIWSEHLAVREDINLKIMDILAEENVSLAYPIQDIYLKRD
ncbi:MAG: mechanosensitive ion channel family protein [Syntrophomonadaceae bacterium]|nr:mechanosensitive ion channel family protein [Syntrophomonadaceae bacterium]